MAYLVPLSAIKLIEGGTMAQVVELLLSGTNELGLCVLAVWSLYTLSVTEWDFSGYSSVLPNPKDMQDT